MECTCCLGGKKVPGDYTDDEGNTEQLRCPHCKGTGIEPEVVLTKEKLFSREWVLEHVMDLDGLPSEHFEKAIEVIRRVMRNAIIVQQKVDAEICRKLGERKTKTLRELERYGNISNERRINQMQSLFGEAAEAIES